MPDPALLIDSSALLPDGISVRRDPFSGLGRPIRVYVMREADRRVEIVEVDPADHMVEWTPPPLPPRWKRWLDPFGSALDAIDRRRDIAVMRGKKVVDWNAVEGELHRQGAVAIQRLLDSGPEAR